MGATSCLLVLSLGCASAGASAVGTVSATARKSCKRDGCKGGCCTPYRHDFSRRLAEFPNGLRHIMAGAASGAVGVTALAPIELVRVNMLLNRDWSLKTAFASLSSGWFRGNFADVLAASARVGITMPTFALYKSVILQSLRALDGADAPPRERLPGWGSFVAGAAAGCTASVVCYPLEVARTRLAVACDLRFGILGCLVGVANEGGLLSIYNGLLTTLAGVLPFNAIKLAACAASKPPPRIQFTHTRHAPALASPPPRVLHPPSLALSLSLRAHFPPAHTCHRL